MKDFDEILWRLFLGLAILLMLGTVVGVWRAVLFGVWK